MRSAFLITLFSSWVALSGLATAQVFNSEGSTGWLAEPHFTANLEYHETIGMVPYWLEASDSPFRGRVVYQAVYTELPDGVELVNAYALDDADFAEVSAHYIESGYVLYRHQRVDIEGFGPYNQAIWRR